MPSQNESLRDLQSTLIRQLKKLHDSLDDVTDANLAQTITREMAEVNHRIAIIGGLIFTSESQELVDKLDAVKKAARKVNTAIANLKKLQAFLDAVSEFLGLVDEAIDIAKSVAL